MNLISYRLLTVRRIQTALIYVSGIIIIFSFIGISFMSEIIVLILTVFFCMDEILLLPQQCRSLFCSIENDRIIIRKGLLIRRHIEIPCQSVRFCRIICSPCQKWQKITDIRLYCEGASETITGLTLRNSMLIQRKCLQKQRQ